MSEKQPPYFLIVDDDAAHRTLLKRALCKAEHRCTIIELQSLAAARQFLFADERDGSELLLAIIDLNLGDGSGVSLLAEIRRSPKFASLPIIVLSTSSLPSDIKTCYDSGADCYLTKSENIDRFGRDVVQAVTKLLSDCPRP